MQHPLSFEIQQRSSGRLGRAGLLHTAHGTIHTPAFIPVGTKATIKGILPETLAALGVPAVLGNTYHLYLEPGSDLVAEGGGIGSFMNWHGPTFTDSGGFQVFSLGAGFNTGESKFGNTEEGADKETDRGAGAKRKPNLTMFNEKLATSHGKLALVDEDGVTFTSHLDGSLHRFTAERSIEIQHDLGADIIFAFDECTSPTAEYAYQQEAMDRTHRWAKRSILAHKGNVEKARTQGLYGIVQGGRYDDLRRESAALLADMDFDGFGIGGSFSKFDLASALDCAIESLPPDKPRHLLGMGEPEDILIGIEKGCDTFDCVLPTRLGRTGTLYTLDGKVNIKNARFKQDFTPLAEWSPHFAASDATYTRAYLHHLFRADEMLAGILATTINLEFFVSLVDGAREALLDGRFDDYKETFLERFRAGSK